MLTTKEGMPARPEWVLALAGFCLILLQFFMIREVTALLAGTELVILLVTLAYFIGYSVGYGVAGRLSFGCIQKLALVMWALHLTIPFSFRYIGGFLFSFETSGLEICGLLFLTAFALSSFYSVLLPRFIDQATDGSRSLVRYYGVELLGAVAGVIALLATARVPWLPPLLYQIALGVLVALLWGRSLVWLLAGAGVTGYALLYPGAQQNSLNYSYAKIENFAHHQVVYSVNTLYQKVDIIREDNNHRFIYLSGRMNYGTEHLKRLNIGLSLLPAKVIRPKEALIVGSGSGSAGADVPLGPTIGENAVDRTVKYASEFAQHVTTCELDNAVIEGSRRWLADVNHLDEIKNWTLHIADAKYFLGQTDKRFDLIMMDVPAPSTIQLGLLHSVDFYRLAQKRLTPHGLISVSLCGTFASWNSTPRTVAAALVKVFPTVLIFTPKDAERSFALAGDSLPFTLEQFREVGATVGSPEIRVYDAAEIAKIIGDVQPMTASNMRHVVWDSWDHLRDLLMEAKK